MNINEVPQILGRRYGKYYTYIEPVVSDPLVRGYFSLIASFFLMAFLILFALSPTFSTILSLQKRITNNEKILQGIETKTESLVQARDLYAQLESQIPSLLMALPEKANLGLTAAAILNTATESGVVLTSMLFKNVELISETSVTLVGQEADLGVPTVQFTFSATGAKDKLLNFLNSLESLRHYVRLGALTISGSEGLVKIDATGVSYYLSQ